MNRSIGVFGSGAGGRLVATTNPATFASGFGHAGGADSNVFWTPYS